jgi:SAM-dependent methyltransferase
MSDTALSVPEYDPTPIFEHFRGSYGSELLTAAVAHFELFGLLAKGPLAPEDLRERLGLAERACVVMTTALRAMNLLRKDQDGRIGLSAMAWEHLTGGAFDVSGYIGLAAQSPGVVEMAERLKSNRPAGADSEDQGAAFIYRDGVESAMESERSARFFTLALAGRARNVAPVLAKNLSLSGSKRFLDVGGGTGIYAISVVNANPTLRAVVWDRPEVLKVAREQVAEHAVEDRVELVPGDMFTDPVPQGVDTILLSNILHDWDVPECRALVSRLAEALPSGGKLLIHDVFLNDAHDGPLPIALYSAALFVMTEGRAYSVSEYRGWLEEAGLTVSPTITPTLIHCGVLEGVKA